MDAYEELGVRSLWPYSTALYTPIVSKQWLLHSVPTLPATTVVRASDVAVRGIEEATKSAIKALRLQNSTEEKPSIRGVVKLGWSWEGLGVWKFEDCEGLSDAIDAAIGCTVGGTKEQCYVQAWVEAALELRLFVIDGTVAHVAYTTWEVRFSSLHVVYLTYLHLPSLFLIIPNPS